MTSTTRTGEYVRNSFSAAPSYDPNRSRRGGDARLRQAGRRRVAHYAGLRDLLVPHLRSLPEGGRPRLNRGRILAILMFSDIVDSTAQAMKDLLVGSEIRLEKRGTAGLKGAPGKWRMYAVA